MSAPTVTIAPVEYRIPLEARASIEFGTALFFKPREGNAGGAEATLAPLIVQQCEPLLDSATSDDRLGPLSAAYMDENHRTVFDATNPTIYTATSKIKIGETAYTQVLYVWWSTRGRRGETTRPAVLGGIRITFGRDGFPVTWEVLHSAGDMKLLFVSTSAERAAAEMFGAPLPRRRYSIEPDVEDVPGLIVVGTVEDGPVPMGPYVYLDSDAAVTTVLCRCSPSQVNEFAQESYYELRPVSDLPSRLREQLAAFATHAPKLRWPGNL